MKKVTCWPSQRGILQGTKQTLARKSSNLTNARKQTTVRNVWRRELAISGR